MPMVMSITKNAKFQSQKKHQMNEYDLNLSDNTSSYSSVTEEHYEPYPESYQVVKNNATTNKFTITNFRGDITFHFLVMSEFTVDVWYVSPNTPELWVYITKSHLNTKFKEGRAYVYGTSMARKFWESLVKNECFTRQQ
jgi:hypothetical protein